MRSDARNQRLAARFGITRECRYWSTKAEAHGHHSDRGSHYPCDWCGERSFKRFNKVLACPEAQKCPVCSGTGHVPDTEPVEALALKVMEAMLGNARGWSISRGMWADPDNPDVSRRVVHIEIAHPRAYPEPPFVVSAEAPTLADAILEAADKIEVSERSLT